MYKFFLYTMLIIFYLGLAKALSPSELGVQYLQNDRGFSKLFKGNHFTAILIDTHATGFFIKTYYQKYRIISGFGDVEEMIVRTSKEFAKKNLPHIGLSLYRKSEINEEFVPLPPGSLYIGDRDFGEWKPTRNGELRWRFHKPYKNYPKYLGWGKFRPDPDFYDRMRASASANKAFYGTENQFGPQGYLTRENFPQFFKEARMKKVDMKTLLIQYFKENF